MLRASYSHTMESPYNENLLLASAGIGSFSAVPPAPGTRNQFNTGFQQAIDGFLVADADYFWKFTDSGLRLRRPVRLADRIPDRLAEIEDRRRRRARRDDQPQGLPGQHDDGPHTRPLLRPADRRPRPERGRALRFRIDHDQAFQQTTTLRYQRPNHGWWVDFTWRYDTGLVAGAIQTVEDALALSGARQAQSASSAATATPPPATRSTPCSASLWRRPSAHSPCRHGESRHEPAAIDVPPHLQRVGGHGQPV